MDAIDFLNALRDFTIAATSDMLLPVSERNRAPDDSSPDIMHAPDVHLMRLPDSSSATRKAPYIIHQVISSQHSQPAGERLTSSVSVRSIFCVYSRDEEMGGLYLLNLMERLRIPLLRQAVIANKYALQLSDPGVETFIYPEDTAPYYAGEMHTVWSLPAIRRVI